jgi:hypothetical protein
MAGLVDVVVLSCKAGVAKPDARIFGLTLARLRAVPGIAGHVHTGARTAVAAIGSFVSTGSAWRRTVRDRVRRNGAGQLAATAAGGEGSPGAHATWGRAGAPSAAVACP